MKYKKGTFVITPNIDFLNGKPAVYQSIFMWLCKYADEEGICFPTRKKLATNIGCAKETIDKYILLMEEDGVIIKTKRKKENSKENTSNLYQIMVKEHEVANQTIPPSENKPPTGGEPNHTETISSINSNNLTHIREEVKPELTPKVTLSSKGEKPVVVLQRLYRLLFNHLYGFNPSSYATTGRAFKDLLTTYSEIQIACLLIVFFNWQGMNDTDQREKDFLIKNAHSIFLFKSGINKYEAYTRNVKDMSKEFDDDELLIINVKKSISNLSTV